MLLQKCGLVFSVQDPGDACVAGVLFLVSVGFVVVIFFNPLALVLPSDALSQSETEQGPERLCRSNKFP